MIGKTLGHYRVIEQLGAGGMGVVYRARDDRLDRDVALKVLPCDDATDRAACERLRDEARRASALKHPHICTIYDVGEADGQTFIVMELVEGQLLRSLIAAPGLPPDRVARYGAQLADALAHAHTRGIIHRDLKTANVVITPDGRAVILDFGLATQTKPGQIDDATRSMATPPEHVLSGTLHYMAPELLRGHSADARSDIWSLGVMLYEMVTAQMPFSGANAYAASSAILHESPAPLPERVPPGLRAVILKCLAKAPGERYQQASEVRAALDALGYESSHSVAAVAPMVAPPRRKIAPWAVAIGVVAVVLAVLIWSGAFRRFMPASSPQIRSLAVLPLENMSGSAEQEYFADGMTEAVTAELSRIGNLRVISRTSSMQYRKTTKRMPQIGKELGVDAVVEGSVLRSGNRVRITAQLIHASTDQHLWADSYEGELTDILALQRNVATTIAGQIRGTLSPQPVTAQPTPVVDPEAHELFLRGQHHLRMLTHQSTDRAVEYFTQAVAKDPNHARAHAGLAESYAALSTFYMAPNEAMPRARTAATKAAELDPSLAEAHAMLGHVSFTYEWDWEAARKHLERAIELNPNSADAHRTYSSYLSAVGRHDAAREEARIAQALDPVTTPIRGDLSWAYFMARQWDQAIEHGRRTTEMHPQFFFPHGVMGQICSIQGRFDEALSYAEKADALSDSPIALAQVGTVYARAGKKQQAQRIIDQLAALSKKRYVCAYNVATIYVAMGDNARALQWLEEAFLQRSD